MSVLSTPVAAKLPWIQGMRRPEAGQTYKLTWQELLFRRLEGRWEGIPTGDTTAGAERALGFSPMSYFYVGRCIPDFGANAIASMPNVCEPLTTPFDTGALVSEHGYIVTDPAVTDPATFVASHTYQGEQYIEPMTRWMGTAYDGPEHYIEGVTPSAHAVPSIALDRCPPSTDGRVWAWEVRVPLADYDPNPLRVLQVYFTQDTREVYADWVLDTDLVDEDEREAHLDFMYENSKEVADAAEAMLNYMKRGLADAS